MTRNCAVAAILGALVALAAMAPAAADGDGWVHGRATFYGDDGGTTIHQGSCQFGNLDGHSGTGHDIAALSDTDADFAGSCGRCYEVACVDGQVTDGFGARLDRRGACKDPSASVVVTVTDTCPCYYAANLMSNKRWCCGDTRHMDMSFCAFDKLASRSLGVIAVRWRRVPCPAGAPSRPHCSNWANCFNTDGGGGGGGSGENGKSGSNSSSGNGSGDSKGSNSNGSGDDSKNGSSSNGNSSSGDSKGSNGSDGKWKDSGK